MNQPEHESSFYACQARHVRQCWREAKLVGWVWLISLLVVGGLNTAISLFYYLRVVKVMTIDDEPEERLPSEASIVSLPGAYIACLAAMMLILFVGWNWLGELAENAARYVIT